MIPIVIIGAGGFGRECLDIIVAMNDRAPLWDFLGFIDDEPPDLDLLGRLGASWLGTTTALDRLQGSAYVAGVGSPEIRLILVDRAEARGLRPVTLIHPSATFGADVEIGAGSVVCSHTSITTNVRLGRYVHLDQNVAVGHDAVMGDFCRVNPGATISGSVVLGYSVVVGTNAAVIQGISIGDGSVVGAGAVVTKDVPPNVTVVGVPARILD